MDKIKTAIYDNLIVSSKYRDVIEQVSTDNRRFGIMWSVILMLYWAMSMGISFFQDIYISCRAVYVILFSICTITFILSICLSKNSIHITYLVSIVLRITLLGAGIAISICQYNVRTIVMYVAIMMTPIMFVSPIKTNVILEVTNFIVFVILGYFHVEREVYTWALMNLAIFSVIGLIASYYINKTRFESYVYANSALKLANIQTKFAYYDQMTNLKNRRAYSEKIEELSTKVPENLGIVMLDINGLKKVNDTYGHSAGDELIIGAADCIRNGFNDVDTIYRLGGDEFCVILNDSRENIETYINNFNKIINDWSGILITHIYIAYGWSYSDDFSDLESLIKSADNKMYDLKKKYYVNSTNDRRQNR